jgi:6-phosphogluconolactonase (cycloisomerase 2 family)
MRCKQLRREVRESSLASFGLDPATGELTKLERQSTIILGPCRFVIDATGKNVLVASNSGLPGVHDRRGDEGGQIKQFITGPKKGRRIYQSIRAITYI